MLTRFVKLTIKPEFIDAFCDKFIEVNAQIAAMPGCQGVQLLQDIHNPCLFFTQSRWRSEADLDAYRKSELFRLTWAYVKTLFADRAEAWSLGLSTGSVS
jgi:heme-degrading monooxygenase HmoA